MRKLYLRIIIYLLRVTSQEIKKVADETSNKFDDAVVFEIDTLVKDLETKLKEM